MKTKLNRAQIIVSTNLQILRAFISPEQLLVIAENSRGEEGEWFCEKIKELTAQIAKIPNIGKTDGQGMNAIARLHYFKGGADWYITESNNMESFGYADLGMGGGELGYIPIAELIANNIELDLYFTPKPLIEAIKK